MHDIWLHILLVIALFFTCIHVLVLILQVPTRTESSAMSDRCDASLRAALSLERGREDRDQQQQLSMVLIYQYAIKDAAIHGQLHFTLVCLYFV